MHERAPRRILVTGGAGFIGSALCRRLIAEGYTVCNADKLTYASNLANLASVETHPAYSFVELDIVDNRPLLSVFRSFQPDAVLHLAAESHVDRSISNAPIFVQTNVVGTTVMLDAALTYWNENGRTPTFRFVHVSTDEVYGDLPLEGGRFTEDTPYNPSSPYSASKAASDFMAAAWCRTYGLPVVISNCSNNYGPYQNIEKLIPLMIDKAVRGEQLPVYGKGLNVRDWLHVDDHVEGLERVMLFGQIGSRYNFGGDSERANIDVVHTICKHLDEKRTKPKGSYADQIAYVTDRLGHDLRYAVDSSRAREELGWRPLRQFEEGLGETVDWYLANQEWCEASRRKLG
ncbi:dTDP-glucose 4,6-dehydratase [Mesorhizobium retamae]|uniref:dTDP-glucose 4,6-dehydratase n=1 Tax=Mesorhizobium retamae TaxID=2912854 RepID=A0ABS9QFR9_9HYPH|nr:dTDP-glucose 4,6-dehydratase [Mesorhizobium sp. IRAMC:0171]